MENAESSVDARRIAALRGSNTVARSIRKLTTDHTDGHGCPMNDPCISVKSMVSGSCCLRGNQERADRLVTGDIGLSPRRQDRPTRTTKSPGRSHDRPGPNLKHNTTWQTKLGAAVTSQPSRRRSSCGRGRSCARSSARSPCPRRDRHSRPRRGRPSRR